MKSGLVLKLHIWWGERWLQDDNCSYHALLLLSVDRVQSAESYFSAEEGVALYSGLYTGIILPHTLSSLMQLSDKLPCIWKVCTWVMWQSTAWSMIDSLII